MLKDKEEHKKYMREYMAARRKKRREAAILYLGGKCTSCDANTGLQFDHKTPLGKSFAIGDRPDVNYAHWKEELEKCQLLCEACHLKKTISSGDLGNRHRVMPCTCGRIFDNIKAYSAHQRWCKAK